MLWIRLKYSDLNIYLFYRDLKQEWSDLAGILCGSYILNVTGFEKSHLPHTILLVPILIIYLGKENRYLHAIHHDSTTIYS